MDEEAGSANPKKRRVTRSATLGDAKTDLLADDVQNNVPGDTDLVDPSDIREGAFQRSAAAARSLGQALGKDFGVASRRIGQRLQSDAERLRVRAERVAARTREADYSRLRSGLAAAPAALSGWVSRYRVRSTDASGTAEEGSARKWRFPAGAKRG